MYLKQKFAPPSGFNAICIQSKRVIIQTVMTTMPFVGQCHGNTLSYLKVVPINIGVVYGNFHQN